MLTLADVDEALAHASRVPEDRRGAPWYAYTDHLLEMRAMLEPTTCEMRRGHAHAL